MFLSCCSVNLVDSLCKPPNMGTKITCLKWVWTSILYIFSMYIPCDLSSGMEHLPRPRPWIIHLFSSLYIFENLYLKIYIWPPKFKTSSLKMNVGPNNMFTWLVFGMTIYLIDARDTKLKVWIFRFWVMLCCLAPPEWLFECFLFIYLSIYLFFVCLFFLFLI